MPQHPAPPDAAPPDAAAYALIPVPVAWCDAQGRWHGANAAFIRYTGQQPDARGAVPLPGHLHAGAGAPGARLLALLQAGAEADDLPWLGVDGQGRALAGQLSLRCQGAWRVVTLLPQAAAVAWSHLARPLGP